MSPRRTDSPRRSLMRAGALLALTGCPATEPDPATSEATSSASTNTEPTSGHGVSSSAGVVCPASPELAVGTTVTLDPAGCEVVVRLSAAGLLHAHLPVGEGADQVWVGDLATTVDAPIVGIAIDGKELQVTGTTPVVLQLDPLPPPPLRERSLAWTDDVLLDDPTAVGLGRIMARLSTDNHGGRLLRRWFERFASTAHSERLGPSRLLEARIQADGEDASAWDLDALPFVVTAIHNRTDLRSDGPAGHCGEFRVSMASDDPVLKPLHLIFLFQQPAGPHDVGPEGEVHCRGTASRWWALSALSESDFRAAARTWLDEALAADRFLAAESLEFIISPWEWRQWFPRTNEDPTTRDELPIVWDNEPLFQTVDIPRLNAPGPDRDAFLQWVADNAEAIEARTIAIPPQFRPLSARLNQGVPWVPLDLGTLAPDVLEQYPDVRGNLEIVGCPACHATDAEFVQTLPDRTFSPFYDAELDARAEALPDFASGTAVEVPFGPLQPDPSLPTGD